MLSKVLNKLRGRRSNRPGSGEPAVDLARAIPGYVSPFDETEPEIEDQAPECHAEASDQLVETDANPDPMQLEEKVPSPQPELEEYATPGDKAEAAVNALLEKHNSWASNDIHNLQNAWSAVKTLEDLTGQLDELARISHNLKGMAATYGYPAIGRIAASLSVLLESGRGGNQHALINLHVEACRAAYTQTKNPSASDQIAQSVCVALETQVKRTISA